MYSAGSCFGIYLTAFWVVGCSLWSDPYIAESWLWYLLNIILSCGLLAVFGSVQCRSLVWYLLDSILSCGFLAVFGSIQCRGLVWYLLNSTFCCGFLAVFGSIQCRGLVWYLLDSTLSCGFIAVVGSVQCRVLLWYLLNRNLSYGHLSSLQKIKVNHDNDKSLKVDVTEACVKATIFVWPAWLTSAHKHRYEDRLHLI